MEPVKVTAKIEIEIRLTEEDISDIVVTALEGGIGYWARLDNSGVRWKEAPKEEAVSETASRLLMQGEAISLIDEEEGETYDLTLEKLVNGFKLFVEKGLDFYNAVSSDGEIDTCNIDAERADCIVQLAVFGDVIYG